MNKLEEAEAAQTASRMALRDLVQRAYEAGRVPDSGRVRSDPKPTADEVNRAIMDLERAAVQLAHARMEETARMCGFEGLTEALGYLVCLRDNPIAGLVREAVNLCHIGDITESDDPAAEGGWGNWLKRATAAVGTEAPPPEVIDTNALGVQAHESALREMGSEQKPEPYVQPTEAPKKHLRCPHDGGTCHHTCTDTCFRKAGGMALTTPWKGFPKPGNKPIEVGGATTDIP